MKIITNTITVMNMISTQNTKLKSMKTMISILVSLTLLRSHMTPDLRALVIKNNVMILKIIIMTMRTMMRVNMIMD
jgi:hypothetical protein